MASQMEGNTEGILKVLPVLKKIVHLSYKKCQYLNVAEGEFLVIRRTKNELNS